MNYKMMGRFIAQILSIEGVFMIPALIISLCYGESMAVKGFLFTILVIIAIAAALFLICRGAPSAFYAKEGLVCVGVSWIAASVTGWAAWACWCACWPLPAKRAKDLPCTCSGRKAPAPM